LMAWTRPVRAKDDVTGTGAICPLVRPLAGRVSARKQGSAGRSLLCDLDSGSIASPKVRILMATCLRFVTSAGGPTWTYSSWP
jgi:hypothetical protein